MSKPPPPHVLHLVFSPGQHPHSLRYTTRVARSRPGRIRSPISSTRSRSTHLDLPSAHMTAYLWLVWYEASSRNAPRHWTLAVSYEANDRAYATVYEVTADFTGLYQSRVIRRVHLTSNHPSGAYSGKILLGEINDSVLCALEAYSETAAELVNSRNHKRGPGTQNCHDWATTIIRSLEDAMLLPQGAVARVEKCPRIG